MAPGGSKIDNRGIRVIYSGENPIFDVVFVHGIQGDAFKTWSKKHPHSFFKSGEIPSTFWPKDLLPEDLPNVRILTFGYNSFVVSYRSAPNTNGISNHADNFLADLLDERKDCKTRPIIFVCHSLGGLIVKRALIKSKAKAGTNRNLGTIYNATYGVIFYGTPHRGSKLTPWGTLGANLASVTLRKSNKKIISELELNSGFLENLSEDFSLLIDENKHLKLHSFYEERPLTGFIGFNSFIVPKDSACIGVVHETIYGIDDDHLGMVKFLDKEDRYYKKSLAVLREFVDNATTSGQIQVPGSSQQSLSPAMVNTPTNINSSTDVDSSPNANTSPQVNLNGEQHQNRFEPSTSTSPEVTNSSSTMSNGHAVIPYETSPAQSNLHPSGPLTITPQVDRQSGGMQSSSSTASPIENNSGLWYDHVFDKRNVTYHPLIFWLCKLMLLSQDFIEGGNLLKDSTPLKGVLMKPLKTC